MPIDSLAKAADEIVSAIGNNNIVTAGMKSSFGGGSLPEYEFESYGLKIKGSSTELSKKLLRFSPAVVCRSVSDGIMLDLRTVMPDQFPILIDAIKLCL
jgi:hypothetical protein